MIKLNWAQIRDPEFNQALGRLIQMRMSFPVARLIQKITVAIQSEQAEADKLFGILQEKFLEPIPDRIGLFRISEELPDEEKQSAQQQLNEFHQTPVEISLPQIDENALPLAELSPAELIRLGPLFSGE